MKRGERWEAIYDYWYSGGLTQETGQQLAQAYAVEKATAAAQRQGLRVRERRLDNGAIELVCQGVR